MKLKFLIFIAAFLCYNFSTGQIFKNLITGTNPNTSNPYTIGQTVVANLTVSGIGRGTGINGTNADDRYNANNWHTAAFDDTAYFEFTLTPSAGYKINFVNFSYTGQKSPTGPTAFAFRSSVDGYTASIGTPTVAGNTISLAAPAFQNITGPVTFRFYGWGATDVGGTYSINDFEFNGAVTAAGPMPEIEVRSGLSFSQLINSESVAPNLTNYTEFTPTFIGSSSVRQYRIKSIGTANLNVTNVSVSGGNAADFVVSASMPQVIAWPNGTYDVTVTFSPSAQGVRSTTVSIANNDSNENPYTFLVQGTGNCAAAANTITPLSGPVGTEVTITASANNLTGAVVTFNGVPAVVTPVTATQIKVRVPAGAASGSLVTTNSQGCSATNAFTVIKNDVSGCDATGTIRPKLFISEVTDHGSGSHSYVEIYNATGATVNLNNYKLNIHHNGAASATSVVTLPGYNLLHNEAYVIAFGQPDAAAGWGGITADLISNTANGMNGNDHLRLVDPSGTWIDLWGDTANTFFTVANQNFCYRRKMSGITAPGTTWNPTDWEIATPVDYTDVGQYNFTVKNPPTVTLHPSFAPSCKSTTLTVAGTEGFEAGNPIAYQWYAVAPGSPNWVPVANSTTYSGATLETLTINDITGLEGYQFYGQVREDGAGCYAASNAVMIHEPETVTWNGSWSPQAPTTLSKVVIAGTYNTVTHGSFEACSVTINPVQSLTIGTGDYVLVETNLTVNGNLVIDDSASLVMTDDFGTVSSAGNTQILRTTDPYKKFDYTYWSSPVQLANIGSTFAGWRTDHSYSFNTANFSDLAPLDGFDDDQNDWAFAGPGATMATGKGYIVMAPTTGTFPATKTVTFSGTVNNGIVTVPLALSGVAANPNDDFNLVGNPYPSAVSATDFINSNPDISGTLYFWAHVTAVNATNPGPDYSNYTRDDYALFNLTGGTRASLSIPASTVPTGYIASGQGFFVEAQAATSVVFNNAMRSKLHNNSDFFRSATVALPDVVQRDRIWLNLQHSDDLFSQQLIGYFDGATLDVDRGYDGIVSKSGNTISFYSLIEGDHYRIQGRPPFSPDDVVPLGYTTTAAGSFTISIDAAEGQLDQGQDVYLQDLQTGNIHDLKQAPYIFTTAAGTFNNRFALRYTNGALAVDDLTIAVPFAVAVSSGVIGIRSGGADIASVAVYDMLGRKICEAGNVAAQTHHINGGAMLKQAYIVKTTLATGEIITRKILLN